MTNVHPTAVVSKQCRIGTDVEIGPYCAITGDVTLGDGVRLVNNTVITGEYGPVVIGARTQVYSYACIGFPGQDVKFKPGMPSAGISIGAECIIREHATVHAATKTERPTLVGDRAFLMVGSHVGHDARVGNDVVLVNAVALGGHADVGDRAILGGGAVVHQFGRIGRLAFIGGGAALSADIPPFCLATGRNHLNGINVVGLRRAGMPREHITLIRRAFREVFKGNMSRSEMLKHLSEIGRDCPPVMEMHEFVATCKRTIAPFRSHALTASAEAEPASV